MKRGLIVALLLLAGCKRMAPPPAEGGVRLVSTAPNLTEIVFAIGAGDLLAGKTDVCDYPPEAAPIPIVGGFGTPRLEPLLAAHPTHILESALADPSVRDRLDALGIPLVHVPCSRLDDIPAAILQIGGLTGREAQAQTLAEKIREGLHSYGRHDDDTPLPRVFLLFAPESPITAGTDTFVSELLALAGGANV
ncbi:MAG: ABC transporter substrate-binding protein, partial [Kiritimatiellaeota bacterium]|nr:ABC transporter substrate-binding protein [Kiritimatiellota bacterium]